jgi:phage FluMu protein Com
MELAAWRFHPSRQAIPCHRCQKLLRELKGTEPDCIKCGYVTVIDENIDFIHTVNKYAFLLMSEGKVQPDGVRMVIEYEQISDIQKFITKLQIFYSTGIRTYRENS